MNLRDRTCSCKKWDLMQLPCGHVMAVCKFLALGDCHQFCNDKYSRQTLCDVYAESIIPLRHHSDWEVPEVIQSRVVLPPTRLSRPPGRPPVERIPSVGEEVQVRKCGRCGMSGHNRLKCSNPMPLNRQSGESTSNSVNQRI